MINKKLRDALAQMCEDRGLEPDEEPLLLDNHAYDNSIIGITSDDRLIYDFESMVEEFMSDENCSEEEALEWVEYNTMRALGYGDNGHQPIIQMTDRQSIIDMYGPIEKAEGGK